MAKKTKATLEYKEAEQTTNYDARYLSAFVCCPGKGKPVSDVAQTLSLEELKQFRKDLLKHSGLQYLHPEISEMLDEQEAKFEVTEPKDTQTWPGLEQ